MTTTRTSTFRAGRILFRATVASLALLLVSTPASATPANNGRLALYAAIARAFEASTDDTRMNPTVRAKVESHRTQAHVAWTTGRNAQARREFMAAARLLRSAGQLPSAELFNAATLALVEENPRAAAEIMDLLAADAATFGEPLVQAKALLEAASQYIHAREHGIAQERVATLRALLVSSHIPDSFRAEVAVRIIGN